MEGIVRFIISALKKHLTFEQAETMDKENERTPNLPEGESPRTRRRRYSSAFQILGVTEK